MLRKSLHPQRLTLTFLICLEHQIFQKITFSLKRSESDAPAGCWRWAVGEKGLWLQ